MNTATLSPHTAPAEVMPAVAAQASPVSTTYPQVGMPVCWHDKFGLLFWLAGAAILFGLHVLDTLLRLFRLL